MEDTRLKERKKKHEKMELQEEVVGGRVFGKKPRTAVGMGLAQTSSQGMNPLHTNFQEIGRELDLMNEKRERLVKASRDVTIHSKKVIFAVHRISGLNKAATLEQAQRDLNAVRSNQVTRLAREMQGNDYWKFRRAFSPGMQEFVEAAATVEFAKTGRLLTLAELNRSFLHIKDAANKPFEVSIPDYILGVGDLTGELMRLAVSGIAAGQPEAAISVCNLIRGLYEGFSMLPSLQENLRDWKTKSDTMFQSLMKVETACYNVHVRGSEYPPEMLAGDFEYSRDDHS
ncbi:hypothetical protein R1flu_024148 [Riccia fluitans]|uniref:Translin-associated protein X n=1 Tax=Riccia fluitans TaxID=41844 RepID=A0ABD1XU27_9MARC